jgi:hypothetical protein
MPHSPSENGKRSAGQEITHFLSTPEVNHNVYKSPPPDPTYRQMNLAAHMNTLFYSRSIILSHGPRSSRSFFLWDSDCNIACTVF